MASDDLYVQQLRIQLINGKSVGGRVGGTYWRPPGGKVRLSSSDVKAEATVRVEANGDLTVIPDSRDPVTFAAGTWTRLTYEIAAYSE